MHNEWYSQILGELDKMERWSDEFSTQLLHFSRILRNKVWPDFSDRAFHTVLFLVNTLWLTLPCSNESIDSYVELLGNLFGKYRPALIQLFADEQEELQKLAAKRIIQKQWHDINSPVDGSASFISVFDSFFNQCVLKYPELYFVSTASSAFLYRACKDLKADRDRFIPWPNKVHNRWNPPGKTYLYLSYGITDELEQHGKYTVNQHTCMEEMRGTGGTKFSICRFFAKDGLQILDLSWTIHAEMKQR